MISPVNLAKSVSVYLTKPSFIMHALRLAGKNGDPVFRQCCVCLVWQFYDKNPNSDPWFKDLDAETDWLKKININFRENGISVSHGYCPAHFKEMIGEIDKKKTSKTLATPRGRPCKTPQFIVGPVSGEGPALIKGEG